MSSVLTEDSFNEFVNKYLSDVPAEPRSTFVPRAYLNLISSWNSSIGTYRIADSRGGTVVRNPSTGGTYTETYPAFPVRDIIHNDTGVGVDLPTTNEDSPYERMKALIANG